jgi:hypothetical protein
MTKTTNESFRQGQTRFSTTGVMVMEEIRRPVIVTRTTGKSAEHSEFFVRAQYVGPTAGGEAHVIVSIDLRQVKQRAAIHVINEELQGHSAGPSTTSLGFVLGP